jgi:ABC-type lipoprotein export system ATPase subunit
MVTHRPALLDLAHRVVELRDGRVGMPPPPQKTRVGFTSLEAS